MGTHRGGCHCGAVAFEFESNADVEVDRCNCSICAMTDYIHLIVPAAKFRLLKGSDALATYTFNTGVARHHFCKTCGIKSFYVPRSNPNGFSINWRCVQQDTFGVVTIREFDGVNWEANAGALAHLSDLDKDLQ